MTTEAPQTANPYLQQDPAQEPAPETDAAATAPAPAASSRTAAMIELVDKLIDVLNRENTLLSRPRSKDLGPVVAEKQGLFAEYEAMLAQIGSLSGLMAETPPEQKAVLVERAKLFDDVLRENELKLDAMVKTSEHIMSVMSKVARKMTQPVQGYGNKGAMADSPRPSRPSRSTGHFNPGVETQRRNWSGDCKEVPQSDYRTGLLP